MMARGGYLMIQPSSHRSVAVHAAVGETGSPDHVEAEEETAAGKRRGGPGGAADAGCRCPRAQQQKKHQYHPVSGIGPLGN